jgi:hypothetical protein
MAGGKVKFGLTLPNRGVVIGVTTVAEMLQLAADAEALAGIRCGLATRFLPNPGLTQWY